MKQSPLISTVKLPGFISFLLVAFINAVVDLGHKIIIQNTIFKIYDDAQQVALTAIVNGLILLPFILLFSPAGFLSDRFSKPKIMQFSALAAVAITSLITLSYYQGWFEFAFILTFILAAQSAVYSPAKYGYVRELAGEQGLSAANGYIQAITIIAILTGIFAFSILFEGQLAGQQYTNEADVIQLIAPIGWILVALSLVEYVLACRLRQHGKLETIQFDWKAYRSGQLFRDNISRLKRDPVIWYAIFALSLFWGVSQSFLASFPAFAKLVLAENNTIVVQGLLACSGIGIMLGSLIAGAAKPGHIRTQLIGWGGAGMLLMLFIIPQLHSTLTFALAILLFGVFGGLFIIPLNALIQRHAPLTALGKILAGNNLIQNIVMLSCLFFTYIASSMAISSVTLIHVFPYFVLAFSLLLLCFYRSKPV